MIITENIFKDLQFVLDLPLFTSFKSKSILRKKIINNGGIISYIITKKSNFLIRKDDADLDISHKCRLAKKYEIPIVSEQFIDACVELKALLDHHTFLLTTTQNLLSSFRTGKIKACDVESKETVRALEYSRKAKVWAYKDRNGPRFHDKDYKIIKAVMLKGEEKRSGIPFCCIEIHKSIEEDVKEDSYNFCIFTHSGHIKSSSDWNFGNKECRFVKTPKEANSTYSYVYNFHKNPPWLLKPCQNLIHQAIGSDKFQETPEAWVLIPVNLDKRVVSLMNHIWSEAVQELDEILETSVSHLTQVEEAEGLLLEIQKAQDLNKIDEIAKLSEEFYQLIPHKNKTAISTRRLLIAKLNLCQLIRDFLSVTEASNYSYNNKATTLYRSLNCHIDVLESDEEEYKRIQDLVVFTKGKLKFKIRNIFRICRGIEESNFEGNLGNNRLLFHASSVENFVGILSRGLLLPKLVVQDGIERTDIGMLGNGIYFSSDSWVSAHYAVASKSTGARLMLVNEVALGKCYTEKKYNTELNSPPEGYNSVHGISQELEKTSKFEGDEFVIYSATQQRMKYLIEFSLNGEVVKENVKSTLVCNEMEETEDSVFVKDGVEKCDTNIENFLSKRDPLAEMTAGLQSSNNMSLPLKAVHIRARLVDLASQVVVFQEYFNDGTIPIEAKYVFPLDDMAAVCGFEAWVNGICYVGEIREKKLAHKQYREAVKAGHGAYLMDEETPEVFTVSVGNLPPNSRILIKITYVAELTFEGEQISFIIPSSVAPWEQRNAFNIITQEDVEKIKVKNASNVSVHIHIEMPFDIKNISCPTHKILLKKTATKATVRMAPDENLHHDFQLLVKLSEIHVPRMWVENNLENDSQACMLTFYPEFEAETEDPNIVIALDCSNSMNGEAFLNAQKLALLCLHNLPSNCRFNVVLFGTIFVELFPEHQPKIFQTIYDAQQFIQSSAPTLGNSEAIGMFESYYSLHLKQPSVLNIILITDGYLNNPSLLLKNIRRHNVHVRVFPMGIGYNVNKHLLRSIAFIGSGAFEYFDSKLKYKWNAKVKSTISKTQEVALKNVSIEWQQFNEYDAKPIQAPKFILSLFNGSRLVVYGFVANCSMAHLKAQIGNQELETSVFTSELAKTEGKILHALTARALIRDWENGMLHEDHIHHEAIKKAQENCIIELSKQYGILTSLTSFIAIEKRNEDIVPNEGPTIEDLIKNSDVDELSYIEEEEELAEDEAISPLSHEFICDEAVTMTMTEKMAKRAVDIEYCDTAQYEDISVESEQELYERFQFMKRPQKKKKKKICREESRDRGKLLDLCEDLDSLHEPEKVICSSASFIREYQSNPLNLCTVPHQSGFIFGGTSLPFNKVPFQSECPRQFFQQQQAQVTMHSGFSSAAANFDTSKSSTSLFGSTPLPAGAPAPRRMAAPSCAVNYELPLSGSAKSGAAFSSPKLSYLCSSPEWTSEFNADLLKRKARLKCSNFLEEIWDVQPENDGMKFKNERAVIKSDPKISALSSPISKIKDELKIIQPELNLGNGLPFCSCLLKCLSPYLPEILVDTIKKGKKLTESDLEHLATEVEVNLEDLNEEFQNIILEQKSFGNWTEAFIKSLWNESDWEAVIQKLTDAGLNSLGKKTATHIVSVICTILVILHIYQLIKKEKLLPDFSSTSEMESQVEDLLEDIQEEASSEVILNAITRGLLYIQWVNDRYPLIYRTLELGTCWELGICNIASGFLIQNSL